MSAFAVCAYSPGALKTGADQFSTGVAALLKTLVSLNIRLCRS